MPTNAAAAGLVAKLVRWRILLDSQLNSPNVVNPKITSMIAPKRWITGRYWLRLCPKNPAAEPKRVNTAVNPRTKATACMNTWAREAFVTGVGDVRGAAICGWSSDVAILAILLLLLQTG